MNHQEFLEKVISDLETRGFRRGGEREIKGNQKSVKHPATGDMQFFIFCSGGIARASGCFGKNNTDDVNERPFRQLEAAQRPDHIDLGFIAKETSNFEVTVVGPMGERHSIESKATQALMIRRLLSLHEFAARVFNA